MPPPRRRPTSTGSPATVPGPAVPGPASWPLWPSTGRRWRGWRSAGRRPSRSFRALLPAGRRRAGPAAHGRLTVRGPGVAELAVAESARGRGVGTGLLPAMTEVAPEGRCRLLTSVRAHRAIRFYRRQGWAQATHPAPEGAGHAVFLSPAHPARAVIAC
ncbi:GNAT family N-acetyltransferase [Streptomyces sp. NPDC031705]|uniref:GNAT family N-acetyltransferase n=1 Tax=Streptomyces sp. NPDC031705 TaxID=3155729 RepID=UPI0033F1BDEF